MWYYYYTSHFSLLMKISILVLHKPELHQSQEKGQNFPKDQEQLTIKHSQVTDPPLLGVPSLFTTIRPIKKITESNIRDNIDYTIFNNDFLASGKICLACFAEVRSKT